MCPRRCGEGLRASRAGHGRFASMASAASLLRLHELLGTDLQGTDTLSLRTGAEALGFEAACGQLTPESLGKIALPVASRTPRRAAAISLSCFTLATNASRTLGKSQTCDLVRVEVCF